MSLLINNKQNHPWWMKHVYIIKLYFLLISCSKKVCQFFFVFQYFFLYLFFQMISTWPQIILIMEITATASGYSKSTVHRQLVHRHLQHQRWLRQHWGTSVRISQKFRGFFFSWNIFKSCPLQFVSLPLEQMFLEASGNGNNLEQPVIHENAAHFVPPPIAMELPPPLPGPTSVEVPPPLPGII